jgi:hypothetical protein
VDVLVCGILIGREGDSGCSVNLREFFHLCQSKLMLQNAWGLITGSPKTSKLKMMKIVDIVS